jgi:hypothetical protein
MMRYKVLAGMLGVVTVIAGGAGAAGADPTNAKKSEVIPITCDINGSLTVATNGNGEWTPGLVTTNNQVGIPYEFHITGTFTPTGGSPESLADDSVRRAPHNGRLDTCTFHQEGSDEFGSFVVDGTVKISFTPAH